MVEVNYCCHELPYVVSFVVKCTNDETAVPDDRVWDRFICGFLLAGGTGIEPATCGFGGRGTLAQLVSCRLVLPIFLRSLFIFVSSSLAASLGFAVKFAINCTLYHRDVV